MRSIPSVALFVTTLLGISCLAQAEWLGSAFNYQGQISQQGELISGEIDLRFSLWSEAGTGTPPDGGEQVGDSHLIVGVPLRRGQFSVLLNDLDQFGDEAFNGAARWLQIEICDDPSCATSTVLSPRQVLTAAPFAHSPWKFNAGNAVFTGAGRVGIGTAVPSHQLSVSGGPSWTAHAWGGSIGLDNASAIGWRANTSNLRFGIGQTNGGLFVFRSTLDPGSTEITPNYDFRISNAGLVGVGPSPPNHKLRISGGPFWTSNAWIGAVELDDAAAIGWRSNSGDSRFGIGQSTGGLYVFRTTSNPGTSQSAARYDLFVSDAGQVGVGTTSPNHKLRISGGPTWTSNEWKGAVELDNAAAIGWRSNSGDSRFGIGQTDGGLHVFRTTSDPGTSQSVARYDLVVSDAGMVGVGTRWPAAKLDVRSSSISSIFGISTAPTGAGVIGVGPYIGVQGNATGNDTNRQAIRGENASAAAGGYAGLFIGTTWVAGTLIKNAGSFRIDHPLDPDNRFLSHSFVESPDMMNIYNGNVTTDANGEAEVALPDYFEALNRDFRYQLTVIDESDSDEFVLVRLSRTIRDNRFSIRSSAPHTQVSWQVTGIRHDPYANAHRIEVESDKAPHEQGKFVDAALYGHPPERNIHFLPPGAIRDPK